MRKGEAARGAQRVKVSAKCKKKAHSACTALNCECPCHAEAQ